MSEREEPQGGDAAGEQGLCQQHFRGREDSGGGGEAAPHGPGCSTLLLSQALQSCLTATPPSGHVSDFPHRLRQAPVGAEVGSGRELEQLSLPFASRVPPPEAFFPGGRLAVRTPPSGLCSDLPISEALTTGCLYRLHFQSPAPSPQGCLFLSTQNSAPHTVDVHLTNEQKQSVTPVSHQVKGEISSPAFKSPSSVDPAHFPGLELPCLPLPSAWGTCAFSTS